MENLERIIRLLKPKYYNRITYLLILCGTSLLTKPLWLELVNWGVDVADANYTRISIPVIGQWDWLLGVVIIAGSLYWNTKNRLIDIKSQKTSEPAYKMNSNVTFETAEEVFLAIYPLLKDNEYLFETLGPNSGSAVTEALRTDLTMWYKYRSEAIIPNNAKIRDLLKINEAKLDRKQKELSNKMILHVDAFEEHVRNESFDYTPYQFPVDFKNLVEQTCFDYSSSSWSNRKRIAWLVKKFQRLSVNSWYVIGSSLFISDRAKDFDIVVLFNGQISDELIQQVNIIKMDFKIQFKCNLHETLFFSDERQEFMEFVEYNNYKLKGNG